jgi:hypothetical protein
VASSSGNTTDRVVRQRDLAGEHLSRWPQALLEVAEAAEVLLHLLGLDVGERALVVARA